MGTAVLLTFDIEAGNCAEDVQPCARVATDLDLGLERSEGIERLVQQVAHHARLRLVTGRADVSDTEIIVYAHMALDEAGDLPIMGLSIVALEDEDVATAGGASVTFAAALMIGVGEGGADGLAEFLGVAGLSRAHAIGETSLFHGRFLTHQRKGPLPAATRCGLWLTGLQELYG